MLTNIPWYWYLLGEAGFHFLCASVHEKGQIYKSRVYCLCVPHSLFIQELQLQANMQRRRSCHASVHMMRSGKENLHSPQYYHQPGQSLLQQPITTLSVTCCVLIPCIHYWPPQKYCTVQINALAALKYPPPSLYPSHCSTASLNQCYGTRTGA